MLKVLLVVGEGAGEGSSPVGTAQFFTFLLGEQWGSLTKANVGRGALSSWREADIEMERSTLWTQVRGH